MLQCFAIILILAWRCCKSSLAEENNECQHTMRREIKNYTSVYEGCHWEKGCVGFVQDRWINSETCIEDQTCSVLFGYAATRGECPAEDEIVIELLGLKTEWVAVSFSRDNLMRDDYVVECVREQIDTQTKLYGYESWNYRGNERHLNQRIASPSSNIKLVHTVDDGIFMYCEFYVKKRPTFEVLNLTLSYDLDTNSQILLAAGDFFDPGVKNGVSQPGNLRKHKIHRATSSIILPTTRIAPSDEQVENLRTHGIILFFTWVFIIPLGSYVARYMKNTWTQVEFFQIKLWYYIHTIIMLLGILGTLLGTTYQLIGKKGWRDMRRSAFHSTSGVIVSSCVFLIFIMGFFIPLRKPGQISAVSIHHGILGHGISILAFFCIITSEKTIFTSVPCGYRNVIGGFLGVYFFVHLLMTFQYIWSRWILDSCKKLNWEQNNTLRQISIVDHILQSPVKICEFYDTPGSYLRIGTFVVISLAMLIFVSVVIAKYHSADFPCVVGIEGDGQVHFRNKKDRDDIRVA